MITENSQHPTIDLLTPVLTGTGQMLHMPSQFDSESTVKLPYIGEKTKYRGQYKENFALTAQQLGDRLHKLNRPPQIDLIRNISVSAIRYASAAVIPPQHPFNTSMTRLHQSMVSIGKSKDSREVKNQKINEVHKKINSMWRERFDPNNPEFDYKATIEFADTLISKCVDELQSMDQLGTRSKADAIRLGRSYRASLEKGIMFSKENPIANQQEFTSEYMYSDDSRLAFLQQKFGTTDPKEYLKMLIEMNIGHLDGYAKAANIDAVEMLKLIDITPDNQDAERLKTNVAKKATYNSKKPIRGAFSAYMKEDEQSRVQHSVLVNIHKFSGNETSVDSIWFNPMFQDPTNFQSQNEYVQFLKDGSVPSILFNEEALASFREREIERAEYLAKTEEEIRQQNVIDLENAKSEYLSAEEITDVDQLNGSYWDKKGLKEEAFEHLTGMRISKNKTVFMPLDDSLTEDRNLDVSQGFQKILPEKIEIDDLGQSKKYLDKLFSGLGDGHKKFAFYAIGDPSTASVILTNEGIANGLISYHSMKERSIDAAVICALDVGNINHVIRQIIKKHPTTPIINVADNDMYNSKQQERDYPAIEYTDLSTNKVVKLENAGKKIAVKFESAIDLPSVMVDFSNVYGTDFSKAQRENKYSDIDDLKAALKSNFIEQGDSEQDATQKASKLSGDYLEDIVTTALRTKVSPKWSVDTQHDYRWIPSDVKLGRTDFKDFHDIKQPLLNSYDFFKKHNSTSIDYQSYAQVIKTGREMNISFSDKPQRAVESPVQKSSQKVTNETNEIPTRDSVNIDSIAPVDRHETSIPTQSFRSIVDVQTEIEHLESKIERLSSSTSDKAMIRVDNYLTLMESLSNELVELTKQVDTLPNIEPIETDVKSETKTEKPITDTEKPAAEPVAESPVADTEQPTAEPVAESPVADTEQPASEPVAEPPVADADQPAAEPVADSPVADTEQPAAEPVAESPVADTEQSTAEPVAETPVADTEQTAPEPQSEQPIADSDQQTSAQETNLSTQEDDKSTILDSKELGEAMATAFNTPRVFSSMERNLNEFISLDIGKMSKEDRQVYRDWIVDINSSLKVIKEQKDISPLDEQKTELLRNIDVQRTNEFNAAISIFEQESLTNFKEIKDSYSVQDNQTKGYTVADLGDINVNLEQINKTFSQLALETGNAKIDAKAEQTPDITINELPISETEQSAAEPVTESPVADAEQPASEPVTESPVAETEQSAAEPVAESPVAETEQSAAKPVAESPVADVDQPAAEPVAESPVADTEQSAAEPVAESSVAETELSAAEPQNESPVADTEQPAAEPVAESSVAETELSAAEPQNESPVADTEQPASEPVTESPVAETEQPAAEPVTESPVAETEQSTAEPVAESPVADTEQPAAEPVAESPVAETEQPAAEPVAESPVAETELSAAEPQNESPVADTEQPASEPVTESPVAETEQPASEPVTESPVAETEQSAAKPVAESPVADTELSAAEPVAESPVADTEQPAAEPVAESPVAETELSAAEPQNESPVAETEQPASEPVTESPVAETEQSAAEPVAESPVAETEQPAAEPVAESPVAETELSAAEPQNESPVADTEQPASEPVTESPVADTEQPASEPVTESPVAETEQSAAEPVAESPVAETEQPAAEPVAESPVAETEQPAAEPQNESPVADTEQPASEPVTESPVADTEQPASEPVTESPVAETEQSAAEPVAESPVAETEQPAAEPVAESPVAETEQPAAEPVAESPVADTESKSTNSEKSKIQFNDLSQESVETNGTKSGFSIHNDWNNKVEIAVAGTTFEPTNTLSTFHQGQIIKATELRAELQGIRKKVDEVKNKVDVMDSVLANRSIGQPETAKVPQRTPSELNSIVNPTQPNPNVQTPQERPVSNVSNEPLETSQTQKTEADGQETKVADSPVNKQVTQDQTTPQREDQQVTDSNEPKAKSAYDLANDLYKSLKEKYGDDMHNYSYKQWKHEDRRLLQSAIAQSLAENGEPLFTNPAKMEVAVNNVANVASITSGARISGTIAVGLQRLKADMSKAAVQKYIFGTLINEKPHPMLEASTQHALGNLDLEGLLDVAERELPEKSFAETFKEDIAYVNSLNNQTNINNEEHNSEYRPDDYEAYTRMHANQEHESVEPSV
ncbi:hypothetical protein [Vibrio sp. R78045]|uniref:hypothetical protein n=1 Tax=Vibrio sp. R78045 TaxID=3093868 RepID=UPI0036F2BE2E